MISNTMKMLSQVAKLSLVIFMLAHSIGKCQNIPIGSWRSHVDYSNAQSLAIFDGKLFCIADDGLFYLDIEDMSLNTVGPEDGLSGIEPTSLAVNEASNKLYVSYKSGLIDIIDKNLSIKTFRDIRDADLVGSKQINALSTDENTVYIATNFGVILLDPETDEIKDSYLNLSNEGDPLVINDVTASSSEIFLATENGLLIGNKSDQINLKDFRNWERNLLDSSQLIKSIYFNDALYLLNDSSSLIRYKSDEWSTITNDTFDNIYLSNDQLLASSENKSYAILNEAVSEVISLNLEGDIRESRNIAGYQFIAHESNGLLQKDGDNITPINPNGPKGKLNTIYQLEGYTLYLSSTKPGFSYFINGLWEYVNKDLDNIALPLFKDVTLDLLNERGVLLSESEGLYQWNTIETSPLSTNVNPDTWEFITTDNLGAVWTLATLNDFYILYNLDEDEVYTTNIGINQAIKDYVIAPNGDHYFSSNNGLIVFDEEDSQTRILTQSTANGHLPSNSIQCLSFDLSGRLWIGTSRGIAYFTNYNGVLAGESVNSVKPIFDGFFLFDDISVNSISFDGGNRLWVGNRDGLWLFDEEVQENISHFTSQNSPLVDQNISQIAINPFTGEAFLQAGTQFISYRTASSRAGTDHSDVKIFPNPVYLSEHSQVSGSGFSYNNEIMITDLAGNLVFKGEANGGTFNWDLQNYNGFRAKPGVYLVFSLDAFGEQTYQSKFVVTN